MRCTTARWENKAAPVEVKPRFLPCNRLDKAVENYVFLISISHDSERNSLQKRKKQPGLLPTYGEGLSEAFSQFGDAPRSSVSRLERLFGSRITINVTAPYC